MISETLQQVRARIRQACSAAGRPVDSVRLLAISKGFDHASLREALDAGQTEFGENYLQEALPKLAALPRERICWHFTGPIQSNKTRDIAAHFDWVHGVERLKIAERLSAQRPEHLAALSVCVQVNVSGEASKAGCTPEETPALCRAIARLPRLRLRGLMVIPGPVDSRADPAEPFRRARLLLEALRREGLGGPDLDTLSAGMSDDLEAAIYEGSTLVRIGSAIFGERNY